MKKLLVLLLVLLAPLSISPPALAQTQESIQTFTADVVVAQDATAAVTETIVYDFGSNQRRGIFRDIPTFYSVNDDQGYQLDAIVLSVARDGRPEQYKLESDSAEGKRLRIGNPDVTITGPHTYEITYTLGPVAIAADDGTAIVRIDAPGTAWDVPVERAEITIIGPEEAVSRTCYQGDLGSTDQVCTAVSENTYASSQALSPGQTITHEAVYEPSAFTKFAELKDKPSNIPWIPIIFGAIFLVASVSFAVKRGITYWRYKRRRGRETVYARYEPPKGMTPADVGLLVDNSASGAELSATLLDLAVRGYIKIKQTKEKRWWRAADYEFIALGKDVAQLQGFEKTIYDAMFNKGTTTTISDMKKSTKLQSAFRSFDKTIAKRLSKQGFYKPVNIIRDNLHARMSDAGYAKWAEVEGFRKFLSVTEKDRLAFHDAPAKKPQQFSEFLPYAVALGVEKQWAQQFKDMQIDTSGWYEGSRGNTALAAIHLNSLTSSLNTMASSVNSTSSGSSGAGGGFSGGGFSGGGGGSW